MGAGWANCSPFVLFSPAQLSTEKKKNTVREQSQDITRAGQEQDSAKETVVYNQWKKLDRVHAKLHSVFEACLLKTAKK